MYKTQNGWTKAKMKNQIKKYNNGTCSYDPIQIMCYYKDPNENNRCAVGCFIPDGHEALSLEGNLTELLEKHPTLKKLMPLKEEALYYFQQTHDKEKDTDNMHEILFKWIDENVEDS